MNNEADKGHERTTKEGEGNKLKRRNEGRYNETKRERRKEEIRKKMEGIKKGSTHTDVHNCVQKKGSASEEVGFALRRFEAETSAVATTRTRSCHFVPVSKLVDPKLV
jgi:hypothetical protein